MSEEDWNICEENKKNFKCMLNDRGRWHLEEGLVFGKWLFVMDKVNENNNCPTNSDIKNFLSGLLEAERRNDIFRENNKEMILAESKKRKQLGIFRNCLDEVEKSWEDNKEEQKKL